MLKAVQNGYQLPDYISEEQYRYIKENKDEDMALSGFVGIACSFGGKWFDGYARSNSGINFCLGGKKSLLKDMKGLQTTKFICMDYKDVIIPDKAIVYADPPYDGTTQYGNKFDSNEFWDYMRKISKTNKVFISEQNAPDDFVSMWEKPFTRTLDRNKNNQFKVTEKLFVHNINFIKMNEANDL